MKIVKRESDWNVSQRSMRAEEGKIDGNARMRQNNNKRDVGRRVRERRETCESEACSGLKGKPWLD